MNRLPRLRPDELDPAQSELYAQIALGPRASGPQHFALTGEDGSLNGPFNALLFSPVLGTALQALGAAVRYETALTMRTRELAILIVAARWRSSFERMAHEAVGRAAGLSQHEVDEVWEGRLPELADPDEHAACALVFAMARGDVADDLWTSCVATLGTAVAVELSTLVGYYATLALQLRVFRVDPPLPEEAP
ncbi:carboxymuconolactone decarboxylase family protein [soil metagenome]